MCAASLKNGGPFLITHCLCQWLIKTKYSYGFIGEVSRAQVKSKRLLTMQLSQIVYITTVISTIGSDRVG